MVCRARCFGLPLCSANAREALAQRLGLLLLGACIGPLTEIPNKGSQTAFAGEADVPIALRNDCYDPKRSSHAGLLLYFMAIAYNKPAICFFNCKPTP